MPITVAKKAGNRVGIHKKAQIMKEVAKPTPQKKAAIKQNTPKQVVRAAPTQNVLPQNADVVMQDESKKQNGKKPLPKSILKKPTEVAKSAQPELLVQQ